MARLHVGACSDTGRVRAENEDSLVTTSPVYAVADGMGGHLAGEVASAMAVDMLRARLAGGPPPLDANELVEAVRAANLAIFDSAQRTVERRGMGTTITALVVLAPAVAGGPERLALANVGDSRAYLLRQGTLTQLSVDHSYVHELVATGQITKDEARFHPNRNIVTRALGIDPDVGVDAWTLALVRGDRFLLCSDGLVDEVSDETITELLVGVAEQQEAAEALVATANRHGGRDNVTVVVIDVIDGAEPPDDPLDIGLEPHWADGEGEVRAWRDDLRLDDTPPATRLLDTAAMDRPGGGAGSDGRQPGSGARAADLGGTATATLPAIGASADEPRVRSHGPAAAKPERASRFNWRTLLFVSAVLAVFVVAFSMTAVYARQGYFVGYRGNEVVIYKGKTGGLLWFDPTVAGNTAKTRTDLTPTQQRDVERNIRFDSFEGAVNFANSLGSTTTVPTTPTTVATTVPGGATVATTVAGAVTATPTTAAGIATTATGAAAAATVTAAPTAAVPPTTGAGG